jgi:hypothetical protein
MGMSKARVPVSAWVVVLLLSACHTAKIAADDPVDPGRPNGTGGSGGPTLPPPGAVTLPDAGAAPDASSDRPSTGPCKPATCTPAGGQYCGNIGDGCGGQLKCGETCPMNQTCGGGGVKNLCGAPPDPGCQPIECKQVGGILCGRVGDGCGAAKDCGQCPNGDVCGATIANVCGQAAGVCDNLCKQQVSCPAGQQTSVSGTVLAPTPVQFGAADPLYNALVYVPNRPVAPFAAGVSCDQCGGAVSGAPLVSALSGADGKFTLKNVPVGDNIPLVIQIGRWRREVVIPKVTACTDTALPAELTRLPRNAKEGSIPQMAIATGTYDAFECVLRKIGVDEAEFTPPSGPGRVHLYKYGGFGLAQPTPGGDTLVGDPATLDRYDIVLLPCDDNEEKPPAQMANLRDYAGRGGRLFLTDWAYAWLKDGGAFENTMTWMPESQFQGRNFETIVDQGFPKGQAFAKWLEVVGAARMPGRIPIVDPYNGDSYFSAVNAPTQRWLYTEKPFSTVQHFTFNAPIGAPADKQCGRVVYSNFHVADSKPRPVIFPGLIRGVFPKDCANAAMTAQEKALEFMLFDASACILPDSEKPRVFEPPPQPPPPPPPLID